MQLFKLVPLFYLDFRKNLGSSISRSCLYLVLTQINKKMNKGRNWKKNFCPGGLNLSLGVFHFFFLGTSFMVRCNLILSFIVHSRWKRTGPERIAIRLKFQ